MRSVPVHYHRQLKPRAGLTLIELVLAIAGCSVLLVVIATLLTSQARLMSRCQESVESARASLRLSQWLRQDLSQLEKTGDTIRLVSSGSSVGERVLQLDYPLAEQPLQLYGSPDSLVISRYVPNDPSGTTRAQSGLLCTLWAESAASNRALPYLAADQQVRFLPQRAANGQRSEAEGVVRTQFHLGQQPLEQEWCSFAEAAIRIRFRYFDGDRWLDRWDSHELQELPDAIEFSVQFIGDLEPQRFIHALPLARNRDERGLGS